LDRGIEAGRIAANLLVHPFNLRKERLFWAQIAQRNEPPQEGRLTHHWVQLSGGIIGTDASGLAAAAAGQSCAQTEDELRLPNRALATRCANEVVVGLGYPPPRFDEGELSSAKCPTRKQCVKESQRRFLK
jgi:hypothetical protein